MRIGVLGPPGVEKSKFAKAIGKAFELPVVDNYAQKIQRETKLALGPWSPYSENFMVAGARLTAEAKHEDRVTVGTVLDTLTYAATYSDVSMNRSQEEARRVYLSVQAAMQGFTLIYNETWDYHLSFFFPYNEAQRRSKGQTWETALDDAYPAVIESLGVPYLYVLHGSTKDRIRLATDIIKIAQQEEAPEETETSETDERAVRSSGEDS